MTNLINKTKAYLIKWQNHPYLPKLLIILSLVLIAIVSIFPFFTTNQINSQDDLNFHKMRLENYFLSVKQGELFPKIFPQAGNTFGYGVDMFYPSILLLPFTIFRLLGLPFVQAYFSYQLIISFATASIAFFSLEKVTKEKKSSYLFALFYTLATYRLIDQSVRGALGEQLAFTFLPLVLLGVYEIIATQRKRWWILALGMSLLIMTHLITAFYTALFLFIFFVGQLFLNPQFFTWIRPLIKASLLSLLMSLWILGPMLEQSRIIDFKFTQASLGSAAINYGFGELLINSLTNVSGSWGNLSPNVGILIILALGLVIFHWKKLAHQTKVLFYVTLIFLALSSSLFPWFFLKETLLARIQFPWRILMFASLSGALLLTSLVRDFFKITRSHLIVISLVVFAITISFNSYVTQIAVQNNYNPMTNDNYLTEKHAEIGHGKEYLSTAVNYDELMADGSEFIFIDDQKIFAANEALIQKDADKTQLNLDSLLTADTLQEVSLPLFYYVGYRGFDQDQQPVPIYEKNGLATFKTTKNLTTIIVDYQKQQFNNSR